MFDYLVPSWWTCLAKIRGCSLVKKVSLETLRFQKPTSFPPLQSPPHPHHLPHLTPTDGTQTIGSGTGGKPDGPAHEHHTTGEE